MEKHCNYCGLLESESQILYYNFPECTRGGRRGKKLERDRKDPFLLYDEKDNIVDACYWCNNAKTNYFTYEEFKRIGPLIGRINRERLKVIKSTSPVDVLVP